MALAIQVEKILFCAKEMQLAQHLARQAPTDYVRRAIARHIVLRARDLVGLAFDALGELRRGGAAVDAVRRRVTTYNAVFVEYYETTRTKLSAHVQAIEFQERIELWTDLEVVKLSYFVDGAKEIYDALAGLGPTGHVAFTSFAEAHDGDLLVALQEHVARNPPDGATRIGSDVLAVTRPNTVSVLNFSPVHQRAGELVALDEWVHGEWAILQACEGHVNAVRILKARIVTDIVAYSDCLTTRTDGDPAHRFPGLDDLLRPHSPPSAIDQLRGVYRLADALAPLRLVRHRMGAHLHRDDTISLSGLLGELDALPLLTALRLFDKLRAVFDRTCRESGFLTSYVMNGAVLAGVAPSRSGVQTDRVKPFDEMSPEPAPTAPMLGPPTYGWDELRGQLATWTAGGPRAFLARQYLWGAFVDSPVLEVTKPRGDPSGPAVSFRVAHAAFLHALSNAKAHDEADALLGLVAECARGFPEPLAEALLRHYENTGACSTGPASLRSVLHALGTLPIRDGEWARAPLVSAVGHEDPLVATEAVNALYRRLVEDPTVVLLLAQAEAIFATRIVPLVAHATPPQRLLHYTSLVSMFSAGQPLVLGDRRNVEFAALLSGLRAVAEQALGREAVESPQWHELTRGLDCVGLAVYISEALAPRWQDADAIARAFVVGAIEGLVMVRAQNPTQGWCNLAAAYLRAGDAAKAVATAQRIMRTDPLAIELHLALVPMLVEAGVSRSEASRIVEDIAATHTIQPHVQPILAAARSACAPTPSSIPQGPN